MERDMLNLNILKKNKPVRIFTVFLGVVVASITCVNPASADETVSVNETTLYRDFQVYSAGGSYVINALVSGPSPIDPVIHLYRGTSRVGYDFYQATVSGDFLAVDDDGGDGLSAYLSGTFSYGLDNYVIRVSSYAYWASQVNTYPAGNYTTATPTESYTLSYTGLSSGTVDTRVTTRQSHNLSFSKSLFGSDKLSDWDGELRKTVDSINKQWGSLIK
jgi:hypothetical protein